MSVEFWRKVVHVEDRVGPHGGEHWMLTLECGHLIAKRKEPFRLYKVFRPPKFAPEKMICISCRILND